MAEILNFCKWTNGAHVGLYDRYNYMPDLTEIGKTVYGYKRCMVKNGVWLQTVYG